VYAKSPVRGSRGSKMRSGRQRAAADCHLPTQRSKTGPGQKTKKKKKHKENSELRPREKDALEGVYNCSGGYDTQHNNVCIKNAGTSQYREKLARGPGRKLGRDWSGERKVVSIERAALRKFQKQAIAREGRLLPGKRRKTGDEREEEEVGGVTNCP